MQKLTKFKTVFFSLKNFDTTRQLLAPSNSFVFTNNRNCDEITPDDTTCITIRICLHDKRLDITPLFTPIFFPMLSSRFLDTLVTI